MQNSHLQTDAVSQWTLADILSSYRFWALFFATCVTYGVVSVIPSALTVISYEIYDDVYLAQQQFYLGAPLGSALAALAGFMVIGRHPWGGLLGFFVTAIIAVGAYIALPATELGMPELIVLGLVYGGMMLLMLISGFVLVSSARLSAVEAGSAAGLLCAPIFCQIVAPTIYFGFFADAVGDHLWAWILFGGLVLSLVLVLLARRMTFDTEPRLRHKPLRPKSRSSVLVAIAPTLFALVGGWFLSTLVLVYYNTYMLNYVPVGVYSVIMGICMLGLLLSLGYWLFRIHGELAGIEASQRLMTPLGGLLVGLFVPMGLPVMLMTLGDILNDRAKEQDGGKVVSMPWLGIFSVVFPPVAMALVQHGANQLTPRRSKA